MADPPPLRLALPPDLLFEGTPAPPPPTSTAPPPAPIEPPTATPVGYGEEPDDITTTLPRPELLGLELDAERADHARHHGDDTIGDGSDAGEDPDEEGATATGRRVRPYTITGGRTAVAGPEIPLEAQVLTSNHRPADPRNYRWETARLVEMLEVPMALVEVAARLEVPVGVARVLVSDLVTEGVLIVHLPPPASSFTSLLEQVLDGVRKL